MRAVLARAAHAREHLVWERAEVVEQTQDLGLGVGEGAHAGVHHLHNSQLHLFIYIIRGHSNFKLSQEKVNEEKNKIIHAVNILNMMSTSIWTDLTKPGHLPFSTGAAARLR